MKLLLTLLLAYSLYGASFWTLSGVESANIYISNKLSSLKPETSKTIRFKMKETLKSNAIATGIQDSPTLGIYLEELEGDEDARYIYVVLALSEEVQTLRENREYAYAITYRVSDFIEVDISELDRELLESVDSLLSQFSEQIKDDKE